MAYSGPIYYMGQADSVPAEYAIEFEFWKIIVVNGLIESNEYLYSENLSVVADGTLIHPLIDEAIDGVEEP